MDRDQFQKQLDRLAAVDKELEEIRLELEKNWPESPQEEDQSDSDSTEYSKPSPKDSSFWDKCFW